MGKGNLMRNLKYLLVQAKPRYWDTLVDGKNDVDGSLIGKRKGDTFEIIIDIAKGIILDWNGSEAYIHYKVCDEGKYFQLNKNFKKVLKYDWFYVPNNYLCHGGNGYGDYIRMVVNSKGEIQDYKIPPFLEDDWKVI